MPGRPRCPLFIPLMAVVPSAWAALAMHSKSIFHQQCRNGCAEHPAGHEFCRCVALHHHKLGGSDTALASPRPQHYTSPHSLYPIFWEFTDTARFPPSIARGTAKMWILHFMYLCCTCKSITSCQEAQDKRKRSTFVLHQVYLHRGKLGRPV